MCSEEKQKVDIISPGSDLGKKLKSTWQKNIEAIPKASVLSSTLAKHQDPLIANLLCRTHDDNFGILITTDTEPYLQLLTNINTLDIRINEYKLVIRDDYPVFFIGTGIGEPLMAIQEVCNSKNGDSSIVLEHIILIEKNPLLFHASLYFFDLSDILYSIHDQIFIGDNWKLFSLSNVVSHIASIIPIPQQELSYEIHFIQNRILNKFSSVHILPGISYNGFEAKRVDIGNKSNETLNRIFDSNISILQEYEHFNLPSSSLEKIRNHKSVIDVSSQNEIFLDLSIIPSQFKKRFSLSPSKSELDNLSKYIDRENKFDSTWLLYGAGDGKTIELLYDKTIYSGQWEGYGHVIYLLEPSVFIFTILLYHTDLTKLLSDKRVHIFFGENCIDDFTTYLRNNESSPIPDCFLPSIFYNYSSIDSCINSVSIINNDISKYTTNLKHKLFDHYKLKNKHLLNKRKLNIAGFTTKMSSFIQYCMMDLLDGFNYNGHNTHLIIEDTPLSKLRTSTILDILLSNDIDILIVIDHLKDEFNFLPSNIPYICWVQDMLPAFNFDNNLIINKYEIIYVVSNNWIDLLKSKKQFHNSYIKHLPMGVNTKIYKNEIFDYKYDVSYITHLYPPDTTLHIFISNNKRKASFPSDELETLNSTRLNPNIIFEIYAQIYLCLQKLSMIELNSLLSVTNRKKFLYSIDFSDKINIPSKLIEHFSQPHSRFSKTVSVLIKSRPILLLLNNGFNTQVWGKNWDSIPELIDISNGIAKNGGHLNSIQCMSKISMNNSPGITFHMRALEIISSKSFMLTRRSEFDDDPITNYFVENEDVVLFNNEHDLLLKSDYYIKNIVERKKIADNAYKKCINRFTYNSTSKKMLNDIDIFFSNTRK